MTTTSTDLTPGELRLYDNDVPALTAGTYYIEVDHTLDRAGVPVATDTLAASQQFLVSAPQFRIDPAMVRSVYPPSESSGRFGTVLPYVVLDDPLLPFERPMPDPVGATGSAGATGAADRQPWLAVLVFRPGELTAGEDSPTGAVSTTVGEFLKPVAGRRLPAVTKAPDVADTDPCTYISVPATVFKKIAPRLNELRFLAHCRHAAVDDQPADGAASSTDAGAAVAAGEALTGVVVANRFAAPPAPAAPATRNIAHLVSLEGLGPLLDGGTALADSDTVAMISLYAWSFWSYDSGQGDFESLARGVISQNGSGNPADLLLRLSAAATAAASAAGGQAAQEVVNRLAEGYVPLEYRTPTGEATFAWYRGPLSPVPGVAAPQTFRSADAARAFDPGFGVFDLSLAAAWQAGRAAALADPTFGKLLLDFRRRTHGLVDALYQRLASDHFGASQVAELDTSTTAQTDFLTVLNIQLLADAGRGPQPTAPPGGSPTTAPVGGTTTPDPDPQAALRAFLADPDVQRLVLASVRDDLDPIASWLAQLLLLEHVPFANLVADEKLLPAESVRFAYLDPAWQDALLDGALSLGIESSLRALYASLTGEMIRSAAREAALVRRSGLLGIAPPQPAFPVKDPSVATALVLRSALVTGWPDIAVRARDAKSATIPALRITRLSPTVLLCLFAGIPASVTVGEPPQGLRFGVEDSGDVPLRSPRDGGAGQPLGAILTSAAPMPVLDPARQQALALRDAQTGVLNLDPHSPDSLVGRLTTALNTAVPDPSRVLGPADVALQMIKSPEALLVGAPPAG
ncbi:hypothetical protein [Catenulispora rubra]|uniref:hypothetical protein n=1 Tax=Catenulispora rubra TaxID=280293 RepID=UPI0018924508|nr:hypothetical protein [Catenulispora rubra]